MNMDPSSSSNVPILYSFRRCPYAMRARMAIWVSGQRVELREVVLRDKPPSLLTYSPKATVPVLVLPDGRVIDESLDVMRWALERSDPNDWLRNSQGRHDELAQWVEDNDGDFKFHLDRFKYATRYEGVDPEEHRRGAEVFLARLEGQLSGKDWLFGESISYADVAIAPFVRQFANADRVWFDGAPYPHLQAWLQRFLDLPTFAHVMAKIPQWKEGEPGVVFPGEQV